MRNCFLCATENIVQKMLGEILREVNKNKRNIRDIDNPGKLTLRKLNNLLMVAYTTSLLLKKI